MTCYKRILTLVFFLAVSMVAVANTHEGEKDKEKQQAEQCDQEKKDKAAEAVPTVSKTVNYSAASEKSRANASVAPGLKSKPDSSSVLSYNFIFYLVYKFKYTESEEEFSQESRTTD